MAIDTDPLLQIMRTQLNNIAGIRKDAVVTLQPTGVQRTLFGPPPNVLRLYDRPMRMINAMSLQQWECIATIFPAATKSGQQVANRNDRGFQYHVQFLVRLTEPEMKADAEQSLPDGKEMSNPLAEKASRVAADWDAIFNANLGLVTPECPQGLVDFQVYDMVYDTETEYPFSLFTAIVSGRRSGW